MQANQLQGLNQYPANPYIMQNGQTASGAWVGMDGYGYAPSRTGGGGQQAQVQGGSQGTGYFDPFAAAGMQGSGASQGGSGWFSAGPGMSDPSGGLQGDAWARQNYSPNYYNAQNDMYGWLRGQIGNTPNTEQEWRGNQPQSLAEAYRGLMGGNPLLEQTEFNRAMARLKGQITAANQGLNTAMAARRGGAGAGAFQGGINQINQQLLRGTGDIATQQAMTNIQNRMQEQQNLLGYQGQDISNRQGWLQGLTGAMGNDFQMRQQPIQNMGGWLNQMMPYEQWNIQTPMNARMEAERNNFQMRMAEEQANAARRDEAMGWLDRLGSWQNQLGGQYYQGQGDYNNYMGNRGQAVLGGYNPNWLGAYNY